MMTDLAVHGHALVAGGKPHCLRQRSGPLADELADGPNGYGLCQCGVGSGWRTSDEDRRTWHYRHVRDLRYARDARARRRLAVQEEARHGQDGGEGGERAKGSVKGSDAAHLSSRWCRERGRKCVPLAPLCARERRFHRPVTW
jgi:hypothetical protein